MKAANEINALEWMLVHKPGLSNQLLPCNLKHNSLEKDTEYNIALETYAHDQDRERAHRSQEAELRCGQIHGR